MEKTTFKKLLQADEDKIKKTIPSNISADKERKQCAENLSNEFSSILKKYNSAYPQDKIRQSAADAEVSVVRRTFDVLMATKIISDQKETVASKEQNSNAPVFGIIAAVLCVLATILIITNKLAILGIPCLFAAACLAYLSGKKWNKEVPAVTADTTEAKMVLDAEMLWNTLVNMSGMIDEKIEEIVARNAELLAQKSKELNEVKANAASDKAAANKISNNNETAKSRNKVSKEADLVMPQKKASKEGETLDNDTLQMFGYLLETLYFWDGVHAHNQLKNIRTYLNKLGIELVDYEGSNEEMFEFVPSRNRNNKTATLRPAMMSNNKLLMKGCAAKPDVRSIFI